MTVLEDAGVYRESAVFMDTLVTIHLVEPESRLNARQLACQAFGWFPVVEGACSRFEPESEVMRLAAQTGRPVVVSELLFEVLWFAVALARLTGGAFDPAIGAVMARRGFTRSYRTGRALGSVPADGGASFRDIQLDPVGRTVTLGRPLVLDLSAVAKGLAIDLAAKALADCPSYAVEAGGDLYARGHNGDGEPWRIGIRHPRVPGAIAEVLRVSDAAVCTSGDYERVSPILPAEHHLVDPRTGHSPTQVASVTVLAPTAMMADGLATAFFVLGPDRGRRLLEDQGVEGHWISPALERSATRGLDARRA